MSRPAHPLPDGLIKEGKENRQESFPDLAYGRLKNAIVEGGLSPGMQVAEQQIAHRLQMSRTPVHQAVMRLVQEGWLRLLPRRGGVLVLPLLVEDMRNVYEVLMSLEATAATRLAVRPKDPNDPIDGALVVAMEDAEEALVRDDLLSWAAADDQFHRLLLDSSGNPYLARLARTVMEQAHRARLLTLRLRPRPDASNLDHRTIVNAILARDPGAAGKSLKSHRERGMATLLPILKELQPRSPFLDTLMDT